MIAIGLAGGKNRFSKKKPVAHPENLEKISKPIVGHWKNFTTHPAIHEYALSH